MFQICCIIASYFKHGEKNYIKQCTIKPSKHYTLTIQVNSFETTQYNVKLFVVIHSQEHIVRYISDATDLTYKT